MEFLLSTMADLHCEERDGCPPLVRNLSRTAPLAARWGLGLEIAEYCTAENLEENRAATDALVRQKGRLAPLRVLHAPYNELFPCAIDPRALALARKRYEQAQALAEGYGCAKLVIHSGFAPSLYYESWFLERSAAFWRTFLAAQPGGIVLCLENVMETEPKLLPALAERVNDGRLRLCLDVGHAHRSSTRPLTDWLEIWSPWLSHLHIHNNYGQWDTHNPLPDGTIALAPLLRRAQELCPDITCTVECMEPERCVDWLRENGFLEA